MFLLFRYFLGFECIKNKKYIDLLLAFSGQIVYNNLVNFFSKGMTLMAKQEKSAAELYREERKARIAKAAKKNQKKHHKVVMTKGKKIAVALVLVVALVAGIAAVAVNNSGVLERDDIALKVGDTEITQAEYGFYYSSIFSSYLNYSMQYETYGTGYGKMYTGYDCTVTPDQQSYTLSEIEGVENPTFADFFENYAKDNIKYIKANLIYAAENGITLDDEDKASMEETIKSYEDGAKENNMSLAVYLRRSYGDGMTKALFEKILEEQTIASKVQEVKTAEYIASYTDEQIEKEYKEEIETFGVVSLRSYVIKAETVKEGEGDTATEKVTDETMAAAKKKAEQFKADVKDSESFKNLAAEYEKAAGNEKYEDIIKNDTTLAADSSYDTLTYTSTDEDFLKWAFDENAEIGSTFMLENEGEGYTVFMMVDPVHKAPDDFTYDVRHILIKFPETKADDDSKETATEVEMLDTSKYDVTIDIDVDLEKATDKETYKKAQDILVKYLDGEKTEEAFGALAMELSEDAESNTSVGGLYEDVTLGSMVAPFENWATENGRKYGDVGIVETEFGYHIMYFVGSETVTWADTVKSHLAEHEFSDLTTELLTNDNVKIDGIVESEFAQTAEFVNDIAKSQIRALNQSSSQLTY